MTTATMLMNCENKIQEFLCEKKEKIPRNFKFVSFRTKIFCLLHFFLTFSLSAHLSIVRHRTKPFKNCLLLYKKESWKREEKASISAFTCYISQTKRKSSCSAIFASPAISAFITITVISILSYSWDGFFQKWILFSFFLWLWPRNVKGKRRNQFFGLMSKRFGKEDVSIIVYLLCIPVFFNQQNLPPNKHKFCNREIYI